MPLAGGSFPHRLFILAFACFALGANACYRVPAGKTAIADVRFEGKLSVDTDELLERIATRASSKFLGVFPGVLFEYEIFDEHALRRDLKRVERYLRSEGFYEARVYAARVIQQKNKVFVTIGIAEGDPILVDSIAIVESSPLSESARAALRRQIRVKLPLGARLDEGNFADSESEAIRALKATGHPLAKVSRQAEVDLASKKARLIYTVDAGRSGTFGPVVFEGLENLPERHVRTVFGIKQGELYSLDALEDGRQALLDLGVFASIDIDEDTRAFESTGIIPITVRVQPAKIRSVLLGAGVELDSLKADTHVQATWQNGNFLGGLRNLELRYKPGIVFYPTRFPTLAPPTDYLYEHRTSATLRQPAFIEHRTTGFTRAEYNVYPVLLGKPTSDVLGYHELRGEVGVERTFLKHLFVSPEYDFQANFPFDYVGHVQGVETLLVSYVALATHLDFRDDPLRPKRGFYLGNDLQLAGGPLQGDATDVRVQPEARAFFPLPKRLTLALRGSVGFLFPRNYATLSQINFANPGPSRAEGATRDYQLLFFRGFFGGGPTSNRGYPIRGIGPHDSIPYLSPAGQSARCNPNDPACYLPTGGLSMWEANVELRWNINGPFSTAAFCDAGDVSPFEVDIRLTRPHLSCGAGARYDTPMGPIRLDVGYRIPGLQYAGSSSYELEPPRIFGLPIAIAFGIGEAF